MTGAGNDRRSLVAIGVPDIALAFAVGVIQVAGTVMFAAHAQPHAHHLNALVLSVVLTAVAVLGIGLWITGIAPTAAVAGGMAALTFYPLSFFAGVFAPIQILPSAVREIGQWTPLGAAVDAIQHAMQTGFPPAKNLLVLAGYALVFGLLAIR